MKVPGPRIATIVVPTPFPVGAVNVHLVLADPVTLVDTGPRTPEAWEALVEGLASHGLTPPDVKRVLMTHGHQDHFGLAERLADAGAVLYGSVADGRHFRMERRTKTLLDQLSRSGFGFVERAAMILSVTWVDHFSDPLLEWEPLAGGETLGGDGWSVKVSAAPGHTPGSLVFEIPEAAVAFTGDTVLAHVTPNAIVDEDPDRPGETYRSLSHYFQTLESLGRGEEKRGRRRATRMKTGHGVDVPDFAVHRERLAGRYRRRANHIAGDLAGDPKSVRELVRSIFPGLSQVNLYLAFSEILGFLMYLEDIGKVERLPGRLLDRWKLA